MEPTDQHVQLQKTQRGNTEYKPRRYLTIHYWSLIEPHLYLQYSVLFLINAEHGCLSSLKLIEWNSHSAS